MCCLDLRIGKVRCDRCKERDTGASSSRCSVSNHSIVSQSERFSSVLVLFFLCAALFFIVVIGSLLFFTLFLIFIAISFIVSCSQTIREQSRLISMNLRKQKKQTEKENIKIFSSKRREMNQCACLLYCIDILSNGPKKKPLLYKCVVSNIKRRVVLTKSDEIKGCDWKWMRVGDFRMRSKLKAQQRWF